MGAIKLCNKVTKQWNKMVQRFKDLFKPEPSYEEWVRATDLYRRRKSGQMDSIEMIHNYLNEKREEEALSNDIFKPIVKLNENMNFYDELPPNPTSYGSTKSHETKVDITSVIVQEMFTEKVRQVGRIVEYSV